MRAPLRLSQRDIDAFVTRQHGWIDRHLELQRQRALAGPPPEPSPEETDALRRLARDYLPGRVAHFAQMMGLYPSGMKITSARKRFVSIPHTSRFSAWTDIRAPISFDFSSSW
ncbi:hypothetical protein SDC9_211900 [bioreactor metagenome]|uniref:Uncharacterized protein n=1 Tax=bioreactor metagenome TaxID=1076179 RepID=A0A645JMZ7_9ZZZZ